MIWSRCDTKVQVSYNQMFNFSFSVLVKGEKGEKPKAGALKFPIESDLEKLGEQKEQEELEELEYMLEEQGE